MPSGTSSRWSMGLDGMHCILIRKLTPSGRKSLQSLPWEFLWLMAIIRKKFWNQFWLRSTKHCPFLCYWLNPRRRLMLSPNISNLKNLWSITMPKDQTSTRQNLTLRPPNLWSTSLKFWKSRKHSLSSMPRKSTRSITSSMARTNWNPVSRWLLKVYQESKSLFPWAVTMYPPS